MKDTDTVHTFDELFAALDAVEFRGLLFWQWEWETQWRSDGWVARVTFYRPDRDSDEMGRGAGRWFHLKSGATAREVWSFAFTAVKLVVDHELLEAFHVGDHRPFDPHGAVFSPGVRS